MSIIELEERIAELEAENTTLRDMLSIPPYDKLSELHHSALLSAKAKNRLLEAKVRELSEMIVDSARTMKDRNL